MKQQQLVILLLDSTLRHGIDGEAAYDWFGTFISFSSTFSLRECPTERWKEWFEQWACSRAQARHRKNTNSWTQIGGDIIDGDEAAGATALHTLFPFRQMAVISLAVGAIDTIMERMAQRVVLVRAHKLDTSMPEWMQIGNDIDGEAAEDSWFGEISLSGDSTTVRVGAHQSDGKRGNGTSSVVMFASSV